MKFQKKDSRSCYRGFPNKAYFAHHENMLIAMLGDDDKKICHFANNKILAIRKITNKCSDLVNEKLDN